jgi:O-antigen/teichoic acid export membrane protein
MRSVLVRAGIAAAIFFLFLYYVNGDPPTTALTFALVMGVIMIPLGMILDRMAHRMAMRRWQRQSGRR